MAGTAHPRLKKNSLRVPTKHGHPVRVLEFDIETAPALGYFYDYKNPYNIIDIKEQGYILAIAWKWRGEKTVHCKGLPDFKLYKKSKRDDYELVKFLHALMSEADFLIGHNGDNFDIKYANARFIKHRLGPPEPYKTRDTLKLSRKTSHLPSHRLDALGKYYDLGEKLPHTGKHLWFQCMADEYNAAAWNMMKRYNRHDVVLLDRLATLLLPWDPVSPNPSLITRVNGVCPKLGCQSTRRQQRGKRYVSGGYKLQYQCLGCGGWYCEQEIYKLPKLTYA